MLLNDIERSYRMKLLIIILTAMFAGAKIAGAISWSWWLVLAPVWIYYGAVIALILISLIIGGVWTLVVWIREKVADDS